MSYGTVLRIMLVIAAITFGIAGAIHVQNGVWFWAGFDAVACVYSVWRVRNKFEWEKDDE